MAEEIKEGYPELKVECVPGSGGIFDVVVDDEIIYSKKQTARFPEKGEVLKLLKKNS